MKVKRPWYVRLSNAMKHMDDHDVRGFCLMATFLNSMSFMIFTLLWYSRFIQTAYDTDALRTKALMYGFGTWGAGIVVIIAFAVTIKILAKNWETKHKTN